VESLTKPKTQVFEGRGASSSYSVGHR
jgi:hypothetical protein